METPVTPPTTCLRVFDFSNFDIAAQKELTETPLAAASSATQDEAIEANQWIYSLKNFTTKRTPESTPELRRFFEMTETIISKLSEPKSTTKIKIDDEMRSQAQRILLYIPFNYPTIDWRTLQKNMLEHLPKILYANYHNVSSPSNLEQLAFGIEDAIKQAVLATPRRQTLCPYANRWWNDDIRTLKKQSNRVRNRYRKYRDEHDKLLWREKANEFRNAVKMAKERTWMQFIDTYPSSTSTEQDSSNSLQDYELFYFSAACYEANTNVSTATFIRKLETLMRPFSEKI